MTRDLVLGIFDYGDNQFQWIDLKNVKKIIRGATGIVSLNSKYFCHIQGAGQSGLVVLNEKIELENFFTFPESRGIHSIIPFENGFLITDTAKNRINKAVINYDKKELEESVFWKYNNDETDTVHLNSITNCDGKLFVSIMGQKDEKGWASTTDGQIIEIPTNKVTFQNIHHPHSLLTVDDDLYWLESQTSSIHRFSKSGKHEIILKLKGFLRGFTFDSENFYVASSGSRRRSKSSGTPNAIVSNDPDDSHCWIYKINRKTLQYEKKDLSVFGTEIFDLVLITPNIILKNEDPILQRIWKYEDVISNIQENR